MRQPTMAAAPCIFALGIVNTRVYNIADNLGNLGIFFYLTILRINEAMLLPPLLEHLQSS